MTGDIPGIGPGDSQEARNAAVSNQPAIDIRLMVVSRKSAGPR
jgi:hypothetical protein